MEKLFSPLKVGAMDLAHRIVMAPLTRARATNNFVPTKLMETYYIQRATKGGLLISEATNISLQGTGWANSPGIYTEEQVEAWKNITKAVHDKGGYIYCQLWHMGRMSHSSFHPNMPVLAPSAVPLQNTKVHTINGTPAETIETPTEATEEDIKIIIKQFGNAAALAKKAGFDGVEIHGANGYLLDQFLSKNVNQRTDKYGGSIENKCRIILEIVEECIRQWDNKHVAIRFSPGATYNEIDHGEETVELYSYLLDKLNKYDLAYVHLVENRNFTPSITRQLRKVYKGVLIAAKEFTKDMAIEYLEEDALDLVAFGTLFISNPDLVDRFLNNKELAQPDWSTAFYGSEKGYIDYEFAK